MRKMRSRCFAWRKMMNRTELFALVKKNYQVEPDYLEVEFELNNAGKNGFPFYMEKEIM